MSTAPGQPCPHCGKTMRPGQALWCNHCWKDLPTTPAGFVAQSPHAALEAILFAESDGWTKPVVVRDYRDDEAGRGAFTRDAEVLGLHGYVPSTHAIDGGHVHAGRIIMTGGLSVFLGKAGTRSEGRLTATFVKVAASEPIVSAATGGTKVCPDCAETVQAAARICRFCRHEFGAA